MGRWGDGEMGRWGDGEMGRWGRQGRKIATLSTLSSSHAPCPMPNAPCPMPHAQSLVILLNWLCR
ncbi:hypothetical protein VF14_32770 [Nostoc linckia z18]|uniref:Uncharacterized protein n=1 Tax=Nostoc linckia z7 TaxID=1628745 RepID=A0ABX4KM76_NOSLI|nr:hypothetical protein [Nostoc linckia]PHJ59344.1 hypothetical protein VF03_34715 [Nostoc linckia z2]PHJ96586.1 hypothetical protein VF04_15555 [Nostoc linckia z7]PHK28935.1 hypothetical protein VF14_32770 [Nostoc linckia z18]